jgi:hypothetical protein
MDATRFDAVARLFARRRRAQGVPGLHALAHDSAGPGAGALATGQAAAAPQAETGPTMLFLQAFKAGSVAPKEGADSRYTLTLEQGLGHTVYFADRPHREVGATPTPKFLAGLGFPPDNPPNAALVVEGAAGETEIAVLQLYAPAYDQATRTATYEVAALQGWQRSVAEGFVEATADLAQRLPSFGAAHLFIDDCPQGDIACAVGGQVAGSIPNAEFGGFCFSGSLSQCFPCVPWDAQWNQGEATYWAGQCNARFAACNGGCEAVGFVTYCSTCSDVCSANSQYPYGDACGTSAIDGSPCTCAADVDGRPVCQRGGYCSDCWSDADCGAGSLCIRAPGCGANVYDNARACVGAC